MRILIAEDDPVTARLEESILQRSAHTVTVATTGVDALAKLKAQPFDVLVTDWMMPGMDGIELIRRTRAEVSPSPAIIMATAIDKPEAKLYALASGADGFLTKPINAPELLAVLRQTQAQLEPATYATHRLATVRSPVARTPPFVAVAIAASTGGPEALRKVFQALAPAPDITYFVVIHGPAWMQHSCAELLQKDAPGLRFAVATHGMVARAGGVYLAPGDRHLVVNPSTLALGLTDDPLVNYVRPAADPLFDSVAVAFGRHAVGVVLTGLGLDGAAGLRAISDAGGRVVIQDPATAVAPGMPRAACRAVATGIVAPLDELGRDIARTAGSVAAELRTHR